MKPKSVPTLSPPIIPMMGKTMKHISALLATKMRGEGLDLTKNQVVLMKWISDGPKPQASLAMITERDKGSLTRLIQSLEKKGLIERVICEEDKRGKWVGLTPLGVKEFKRAVPILEACFELLLDGISEKEKETARNVLIRIMENAAQDIQPNCKCL